MLKRDRIERKHEKGNVKLNSNILIVCSHLVFLSRRQQKKSDFVDNKIKLDCLRLHIEIQLGDKQ